VAAARLRPDNRAVLVYEPVTSKTRPAPQQANPAATVASRKEPGGDRCSGDHGLPPAADPGPPKSWAFPVPERGVLANGLTVLRCHRPAGRWWRWRSAWTSRSTPSPQGSTASPRSWSGRCLRHGDTHRRGIRSRTGALRRDARRTRRLRGRACLAGGARLRLAKALELLPRRCTRPPSPTARSSVWCATVWTRSDRDGQPGQRRPGSWRTSCSGVRPAVRPRQARGHGRKDRRGERARVLPGSNPAGPGNRGGRGRPDECGPGCGTGRHARPMGRQQRGPLRPPR